VGFTAARFLQQKQMGRQAEESLSVIAFAYACSGLSQDQLAFNVL